MAQFLQRELSLLLALGLTGSSIAQVSSKASSQLRRPQTLPVAISPVNNPLEDELFTMSQQAAVIFAGEVLSVQQKTGNGLGGNSGWVEIKFRIEQAVRGCVGQATYILREWVGLWAGDSQRYRVGQHLLLLLHAPSAAGLSSPVGGQDGVIPITGSRVSQGVEETSSVSDEEAVDLRWVQTRIARAGFASMDMGNPTLSTDSIRIGRAQHPVETRKASPPIFTLLRESGSYGAVPATVPPREVTLASVLAMLGAWEARQSHAAQ